MQKGIVNENLVVYQNDAGNNYLLNIINPQAAILALDGLDASIDTDLEHIWEDRPVNKLIVFIPEEQKPMAKLARNLGFKQEGRLKKATPEGDLLVFGQYRLD